MTLSDKAKIMKNEDLSENLYNFYTENDVREAVKELLKLSKHEFSWRPNRLTIEKIKSIFGEELCK